MDLLLITTFPIRICAFPFIRSESATVLLIVGNAQTCALHTLAAKLSTKSCDRQLSENPEEFTVDSFPELVPTPNELEFRLNELGKVTETCENLNLEAALVREGNDAITEYMHELEEDSQLLYHHEIAEKESVAHILQDLCKRTDKVLDDFIFPLVRYHKYSILGGAFEECERIENAIKNIVSSRNSIVIPFPNFTVPISKKTEIPPEAVISPIRMWLFKQAVDGALLPMQKSIHRVFFDFSAVWKKCSLLPYVPFWEDTLTTLK